MTDTKTQLLEILEVYNIGKKPLARLLGWGDTTVMNQLKAATASGEFAEKINAIWESPYIFSEILEQNKRKLTEVAYRKAKLAVEKRILKDKSSNIVMYLIRYLNGDVAPYQVNAILFYSQAASLLLKGSPLFDDDVLYRRRSIMPYPTVYENLIKNGAFRLKNVSDVLTQDEKDIVSGVSRLLNMYSPNAVKAVLKADRAGLLMKRGDREKIDTEGICISLSELQSYFSKETQEIGFMEIKDYKKYFEKKLKNSRSRNGN